MAQAKWEQVYIELQRKSERLGYAPPKQIGGHNSQVFEFRVDRDPILLLAFRDLARKENYSMPNALWAEGLDLVLERYNELAAEGRRLPQAAAIVIDNIRSAYAVVMISELLELYRRKGAPESPDGSRRFTFVVMFEDGKYWLKMPYGEPPLRVTGVNSVEQLVLLLKAAKAPLHGRPAN